MPILSTPKEITNFVLATFPMKYYIAMDIWKSFHSFIHLTFRQILRRWHKKEQSSLKFAIDFFNFSNRERGREGGATYGKATQNYTSLVTSECRRKFSKSRTVGKPTVRICTCLDSAVHPHKQHKQGVINYRAPGNTCLINLLILNCDFQTQAKNSCAVSNNLADIAQSQTLVQVHILFIQVSHWTPATRAGSSGCKEHPYINAAPVMPEQCRFYNGRLVAGVISNTNFPHADYFFS